MRTTKQYEIAIIGGGIVGMATAMALAKQAHPSMVILEAEGKLAAHQTGHNSGVIHSGLYYKPGSLKAKNCVEGREAMYRFCEKYDIPHDRSGKVVIATHEDEIVQLDKLEERGKANGLVGIRRLNADEIKEYEPHTVGVAGLHVPQTGIVDYKAVTRKYADIVQEEGDSDIETSARVLSVKQNADEYTLITERGEVHARHIINCAGLYSDRIARMCEVDPGLQIIPFRGEYYELSHEKEYLVNNLIYPVPDPRFPFLGVHFTRMIHGGIEAGPNAVLGFAREGYKLTDISVRDLVGYGLFPGFWRMAMQYWQTGIGEMYRSFSKRAFVNALQKLIPDLKYDDVHRAGSGVRAQALEPDGKLVDDFRIVETDNMIHVLNAPSPAATSSISIGQSIARMAIENFDLKFKKPAREFITAGYSNEIPEKLVWRT
jgi:L-2-hydroxyglutarate oxidase